MDIEPRIESGERRRAPRIFDTDWLVLRGMYRAIGNSLATLKNSKGSDLVDLGCGTQPYRRLVEEHGFRYLGADLGTEAEIAIVARWLAHVQRLDATDTQ